MHKTFEMNWTKIKDVCQSRRKVVTYNSKSDLPLMFFFLFIHHGFFLLNTIFWMYPIYAMYAIYVIFSIFAI